MDGSGGIRVTERCVLVAGDDNGETCFRWRRGEIGRVMDLMH